MQNTLNNQPVYFNFPIEEVILADDNGQKVEIIAVPYDKYATMEDELRLLNDEKKAMQESMKDMAKDGQNVSMFKDHTWFPDELWQPDDNDVESTWWEEDYD